ncbi:substrate-binding domain-containing protein [Paenibacillus pasadenensis]|uniref:substrate-binding domain-containing protein n=1 Tax=Paenibacillus pasadenensis TaxID=217090 RepID=UPI003F7EA2D9
MLQTIEELGYHPNAVARSLTNKRTRTIGVLFPMLSSEFAAGLLQGIESYAHACGYSVLVCNTDEDGKRTLDYLQTLREKQADGILFVSEALTEPYLAALRRMDVPVVLINSETADPRFPHVKVDDAQAAYDAASYLIAQGHRDIAMIAGTEKDPVAGAPRVQGCRQALLDHGLPWVPERVVYGDFFYESGAVAMRRLLERGLPFTAVFAASDEMAAGAMHHALAAGIRVPEELSVIGYDDIRLARMVHPPLTTVHQPLAELGRTAVEKLIAMAETGQPGESVRIAHRIVERQSVRSLST